jgi:hypothetical protein
VGLSMSFHGCRFKLVSVLLALLRSLRDYQKRCEMGNEQILKTQMIGKRRFNEWVTIPDGARSS